MRSGQQNRYMPRGRGNGNRKSVNPLTRAYESNGPDVKIRGSAQHIAEKYAILARDALSSGDRVMAENYLQHAEHYNRIIFAAQLHVSSPATFVDVSEEVNLENPIEGAIQATEEVIAENAETMQPRKSDLLKKARRSRKMLHRDKKIQVNNDAGREKTDKDEAVAMVIKEPDSL